ncbi:hypothetical protein B0J11DRAFT_580733 [Dendryphion nanum]|uniref:CFEM domain-containing protein n=1 Tax=Dendryphion nanum TaxID=256645 RepID=A0A9P9DRJ5_9PLEO|nr:hypothetical protein B0J11DRAFT_580733 [Dendryphion nanum]
MKANFHILFLFFAFLPFGFAQGTSLSTVLEALPPCAVRCLVTSIATSPCSPTDQKCICTNAQLQSSIEVCVLRNCTIKQGLTTKNITMTACGAPIRDRSALHKIVGITLGVISAAFVLVRIVYKYFVTFSELGLDDYFIVLTLFSGIPGTIINDLGTIPNGLARDIWTLEFSQITNFVRWFYVMEVLYFTQVFLLKLSLLFFYQRIFPGARIRQVIAVTVGFDVLYGVAFIVCSILQCQPISHYWNSWDGEHEGKCININALAWANAVISIVLDIWMLAIPFSQIIHLRMAWKKKVGVGLMFSVGTFVTVVSILRLQTLVSFANSHNPTWDQKDVNNWSVIEINVGIMCACMPAIRVILVRLSPRVFGTNHSSSNKYYAKYGSRSRVAGKGGIGSNNLTSGTEIERNGRDGIKFSKTFEVEHGSTETDEVGLVEMDNLSRNATNVKSGSSSQVSL